MAHWLVKRNNKAPRMKKATQAPRCVMHLLRGFKQKVAVAFGRRMTTAAEMPQPPNILYRTSDDSALLD